LKRLGGGRNEKGGCDKRKGQRYQQGPAARRPRVIASRIHRIQQEIRVHFYILDWTSASLNKARHNRSDPARSRASRAQAAAAERSEAASARRREGAGWNPATSLNEGLKKTIADIEALLREPGILAPPVARPAGLTLPRAISPPREFPVDTKRKEWRNGPVARLIDAPLSVLFASKPAQVC